MNPYKRRVIVIPMVVFFLTFGMLMSMFFLLENRAYYQKREQFFYLAANQSSIIGGCLDTVIARTYTLSAMIEENEGATDFFDKVSKKIYDEVYKDTGVMLKNIAIAPNGVVEKVYPLVGNEQLVGFNFMDVSKEGNKEAIEAFQKGDIVMTAPFELAQGGKGIAARLPVIVDTPEGAQLWGLVTVTFDYDNLMDYFKLSNLKNMGANYRLWYTSPDGKQIVLQESDEIDKNTVGYDVNVKNMIWHLEVSPRAGWMNLIEIFGGMVLILFISASLAYFVSTRERIRRTNKEIVDVNKKLEYMAVRDNLTACYSRHYVSSALIKLPEGEWCDPTVKYSLAIVDIDEFKTINDTYGHDMGDQVIVSVANALKSVCDEQRGDCVIRYGGDEFVVLFNDVEKKRLENMLETMLLRVRNICFSKYPEVQITISVGAMFADEKINKYYDLLSNADEKLYKSKENGRNQYTL